MNDFQEHSSRLCLIPKRPSQQPGRPLAFPKRLLIQPSVPSPISIEITELPGQLVAHPNYSSIQGNEVDNRSLLSEMATVEYEALRPREYLEMATVKYEALRHQEYLVRKKMAISYPAVVSSKRLAKSSFLARVASLFK